jgi:hypothetical protein
VVEVLKQAILSNLPLNFRHIHSSSERIIRRSRVSATEGSLKKSGIVIADQNIT